MNTFDLWAIIITLTAVFGYLNYRLLKLPSSSGIFALTLATSLLLLAVDFVLPSYHLKTNIAAALNQFDFSTTLLHGTLCFLLFAGAWNVNWENFRQNRRVIVLLAVVGVLISTFVIGVLAWLLFALLGLSISLVGCLIFGALISPTDPISVLGLLKKLNAPMGLEAQIAGESLFNDGVGVVAFFAFLSLAGLDTNAEAAHIHFKASSLSVFFLREMAGGIILGLIFGYVAFAALRTINHPSLELLITLATVMSMYTVSFWIDVSGPIAVVVAGILIGNYGRRHAMSEPTAEHINAFWEMIDYILNSALFLLLGLELFVIHIDKTSLYAALLIIPIVLAGRWVSVGLPIGLISLRAPMQKGLIPILTWGGLRGGISVAMVLSLPSFAAKDMLVSCTYAVVLFSVMVQTLTMKPLLQRYGICQEAP